VMQAIFDRTSHVNEYCTPFLLLRDSHPAREDFLYIDFSFISKGDLGFRRPSDERWWFSRRSCHAFYPQMLVC
jgi:hypothetical protein